MTEQLPLIPALFPKILRTLNSFNLTDSGVLAKNFFNILFVRSWILKFSMFHVYLLQENFMPLLLQQFDDAYDNHK